MSEEGELVALGIGSSPLLEGMGDVLELGVLILDKELVVRGCNRWLATALGITPQDLIGRPFFERFAELETGAAGTAVRRALDGATTVWSHQFHRYLLPMRSLPGHEAFDHMQQSARITPIMREGEVDGVLVLVQDVTERVAREQELRSALKEAQAASQAKSDFLASISHELRTPLGAIVGFMELLLGDMVGPVSALQQSYLGRVRAAARHLLSVIEEILTFSRVDAGKEPVHLDDVDAVSLARDVGELLEPQAGQKGLRFTAMLPESPVMLRTDATKVRQILINLVGNAVKFTDSGRVTLTVRRGEAGVEFLVEDTGPGITALDAVRIFDPFTQVDQSLKRQKGGTGLGLPVSRRLARLLGGEITVESVVGRGAVFTLSLPLVTADYSLDTAVEKPAAATTPRR